MSGHGRDCADRLLAVAVWLLPPERLDWGRAMRGELAAIEPARARWQHALGCVRTVATLPAALRRIGYPALTAGTLITLLAWTSGIGYGPLRWGEVAVVSVLLAVAWWGRYPGLLGPVGTGRAARLVRTGGCLLVAAMTTAFAVSAPSHGSPNEQARNGVPIFAVLLTSYLVGFLAVTARRTAATGRVLASGKSSVIPWGRGRVPDPLMAGRVRGGDLWGGSA